MHILAALVLSAAVFLLPSESKASPLSPDTMVIEFHVFPDMEQRSKVRPEMFQVTPHTPIPDAFFEALYMAQLRDAERRIDGDVNCFSSHGIGLNRGMRLDLAVAEAPRTQVADLRLPIIYRPLHGHGEKFVPEEGRTSGDLAPLHLGARFVDTWTFHPERGLTSDCVLASATEELFDDEALSKGFQTLCLTLLFRPEDSSTVGEAFTIELNYAFNDYQAYDRVNESFQLDPSSLIPEDGLYALVFSLFEGIQRGTIVPYALSNSGELLAPISPGQAAEAFRYTESIPLYDLATGMKTGEEEREFYFEMQDVRGIRTRETWTLRENPFAIEKRIEEFTFLAWTYDHDGMWLDLEPMGQVAFKQLREGR